MPALVRWQFGFSLHSDVDTTIHLFCTCHVLLACTCSGAGVFGWVEVVSFVLERLLPKRLKVK